MMGGLSKMRTILIMRPDGTLDTAPVDNSAPLPDEWIMKMEARRAVDKERKDAYRKRARKELRRKYQRKDLQKDIAKMRTVIEKINMEREAGTLPALCDLEFTLAIEAAEVSTEVRRRDVILESESLKAGVSAIKQALVISEEDWEEFKL